MKVRLETFYPEGFNLCGNMDKLKLQTNDQKLANYGRGTVFDIPENIRRIWRGVTARSLNSSAISSGVINNQRRR